MSLASAVREHKRLCMVDGPIAASLCGGGAVLAAFHGWPWAAFVLTFLAGSVVGSSLMSLAWLRSHYRPQWDAAKRSPA